MTASDAFAGRDWKYWTVPEIITVDGTETAYRRGGSGPTLVYLHGEKGTREWSPLHQELAKNFDVIAPEHPGFGDTVRGVDQDTWEAFVLHYAAFFRALELEEFHLVGNSFGAWLAAKLAIFYPERFTTLTLIAPMGVLVDEDPFIDIFRFTEEKEAAARYNGRQDQNPDRIQVSPGDDAVRHYGEMATVSLLSFTPRYDRSFAERLPRVEIPALVVGVEDDRYAGTGQAKRFADLLPEASLVTIAGPNGEPSSHSVVVEQPAEVASAVADFLSKKA